MPAIIATVEWAGRSGWSDACRAAHALGADLTEHRERPPDVGDAGVGDLLLAERLGCHQRQQQALMFDEHVVELPDEMAGQLLLVGLLGDDRLPRPAEFSTKSVNGKTRASRNSAGLGAEVAKQQILGDACGLAISRVVVLR